MEEEVGITVAWREARIKVLVERDATVHDDDDARLRRVDAAHR